MLQPVLEEVSILIDISQKFLLFKQPLFIMKLPNTRHASDVTCPHRGEKAQIWTTLEDASHSRKKPAPYPVHTLSKMQGTSSKAPNSAPQIAWVKQQPQSELVETVDEGHRHSGKGIYHESALSPIPSPPRETPKKPVKDDLIPMRTGNWNS